MTNQTLPCREAFEVYARADLLSLTRRGNGYASNDTQSAWHFWQMAWNTRAQSSAPEGGEAVAEVDELDNEFGPGTPCITMLGPMPPIGTKLYTRSNAQDKEK